MSHFIFILCAGPFSVQATVTHMSTNYAISMESHAIDTQLLSLNYLQVLEHALYSFLMLIPVIQCPWNKAYSLGLGSILLSFFLFFSFFFPLLLPNTLNKLSVCYHCISPPACSSVFISQHKCFAELAPSNFTHEFQIAKLNTIFLFSSPLFYIDFWRQHLLICLFNLFY